jgi:hypothetical protein
MHIPTMFCSERIGKYSSFELRGHAVGVAIHKLIRRIERRKLEQHGPAGSRRHSGQLCLNAHGYTLAPFSVQRVDTPIGKIRMPHMITCLPQIPVFASSLLEFAILPGLLAPAHRTQGPTSFLSAYNSTYFNWKGRPWDGVCVFLFRSGTSYGNVSTVNCC